MKRPHLLIVEEGAEAFASLLQAARAAGVKVGWLDVGEAEPEPLPPGLGQAAAAGVLRAVAVGPGGSVAVKRRGGPPVLDDLLREHFLGCRLVLVRTPSPEAISGLASAPRLTPGTGDTVRLERPDAPALDLAPEALVDRLGRPRPWG